MTIEEIRNSAIQAIRDARIMEALEKVRIHYLGRKGLVTQELRSLGELALSKRRELGPKIQAIKKELENLIENKKSELTKYQARDTRYPDLTAPGRKKNRGHLHPLTLVEQRACEIFRSMNFSVVLGPEVETEYYNFDALNIPPDHPARDMWDTFWLATGSSHLATGEKKNTRDKRQRAGSAALLLRTHTSPVQVRYMETHHPPFQIIAPGRVFRYEATDATHEINFYQLEGLMVGKQITLANFKFVVEHFLKKFFAPQDVQFRYRPSYFPFTEPSVEVDIKLADGNRQLATGKKNQQPAAKRETPEWLEVMGAGMVHPRVFEYAHYNPRDWQGFAFGVGLDRLAMIKYKIPDIRLFYSGDLRFVRQF